MILNEKKLKCYNKDDIEEIITKIKDNYREFKNKIEILKLFGKIINKTDIDEDSKSISFNYKSVYSKCTILLNKILFGLSKLSKEYLNVGELISILSLEVEGDDNNNIKDNINNENIEKLGSLLKKELDDSLNNITLGLEDNLNLNSETNFNSCLNNNINLTSDNNTHINGNGNLVNDFNILIPK